MKKIEIIPLAIKKIRQRKVTQQWVEERLISRTRSWRVMAGEE